MTVFVSTICLILRIAGNDRRGLTDRGGGGFFQQQENGFHIAVGGKFGQSRRLTLGISFDNHAFGEHGFLTML